MPTTQFTDENTETEAGTCRRSHRFRKLINHSAISIHKPDINGTSSTEVGPLHAFSSKVSSFHIRKLELREFKHLT